MEALYNRDALKRPGRAVFTNGGVRSQYCETANTINVDLISFCTANSLRYERICERSQRGTKGNDMIGRNGRERCWRRVLVTKEHVAAVDAAVRKDGGWSGEFHNALVPGNPERRMIGPVSTIRELSSHRSCQIGSCLKESRRKGYLESHGWVSIIRRRFATVEFHVESRRIMLQVNWKLISLRRERRASSSAWWVWLALAVSIATTMESTTVSSTVNIYRLIRVNSA